MSMGANLANETSKSTTKQTEPTMQSPQKKHPNDETTQETLGHSSACQAKEFHNKVANLGKQGLLP